MDESCKIDTLDQPRLVEIARTARDLDLREAAVQRMTAQAALMEIIGSAGDDEWRLRKAAARNIENQAVLAKLAQCDRDPRVRRAAATRLTDQALLAEITKSDPDLDVCSGAHVTLSILRHNAAESALVAKLRERKPALEELLSKNSGERNYEDPVYRFYHASYKVYRLQAQTQEIVAALAELGPDRKMHPWFLEIVSAGTGKEFVLEDNDRWTEATRPIVEAFFHARFFLEMAVRYADLEEPPRPLPSGYAALLSLYGLR